jgi:hypothetical protein
MRRNTIFAAVCEYSPPALPPTISSDLRVKKKDAQEKVADGNAERGLGPFRWQGKERR